MPHRVVKFLFTDHLEESLGAITGFFVFLFMSSVITALVMAFLSGVSAFIGKVFAQWALPQLKLWYARVVEKVKTFLSKFK